MRRPRLTYANVTSSLALFLALGGTGYAVTKLPRNSVGTTQIKANAVTSGKIRAGAVQRSDLAPSARAGSGGGGSRGPRGPAGPSGAKGDTGPSETIQANRPDVVLVPPATGGTVTVSSLTLSPGDWIVDANTALIYDPPGTTGSEYFELLLQTAGGDVLAKSVTRAGNVPGASISSQLPVRVAVDLQVTTQVRLVITHGSAVPSIQPAQADPYVDRTTFQATRTGSLENR